MSAVEKQSRMIVQPCFKAEAAAAGSYQSSGTTSLDGWQPLLRKGTRQFARGQKVVLE